MSKQLARSKMILEILLGWEDELSSLECDDYRDLKEDYEQLESALGDLIERKKAVIEDEKARMEKRKKKRKQPSVDDT
jgi:hypothetical protein